jgi:MoaA/NifB/PqqE/SkfB family radical SAM enzyme
MNISEYEKLFISLGSSPEWITFSGGEPFIRKDITEIASLLYTYCKPAIINIPTNGLLPEKIISAVQTICSTAKKSSIIINLSLDEYDKNHDELRGVPGNWEKAMRTLNGLKDLKNRYTNLTIGIHTVISAFNVKEFEHFFPHLLSLNADNYISEIAERRQELQTTELAFTPKPDDYEHAVKLLLSNTDSKRSKPLTVIASAFRREYYNHVFNVIRGNNSKIYCQAGNASVQVAPDGNIWFCCIKAENVGNLRDNNFDFKHIWSTKKARSMRKTIITSRCTCPLANAGYTNLLMNFPSLFRVSKTLFKHFILPKDASHG